MTSATFTDPAQLGTILSVWAHPDDEAYLASGIMAAAVRNGQRVVCATATKGEAGSQDETRWPSDRIADIRAAELAESLSILGIDEHRFLGFVDGRCPEVPDAEGIASIEAIVDEVRPQTVLTFGPLGATGHPDHIAVSRWATAAFEAAAPEGSTLYYASNTPEWVAKYEPIFRPYNVYDDDTPEVTPAEELGIHFHLDDELGELKAKALLAQISQTEGLWNAIGVETVTQMMREEMYAIGRTN
jgi:LmbE family N-acetylglucosaminyl deacetylase